MQYRCIETLHTKNGTKVSELPAHTEGKIYMFFPKQFEDVDIACINDRGETHHWNSKGLLFSQIFKECTLKPEGEFNIGEYL